MVARSHRGAVRAGRLGRNSSVRAELDELPPPPHTHCRANSDRVLGHLHVQVLTKYHMKEQALPDRWHINREGATSSTWWWRWWWSGSRRGADTQHPGHNRPGRAADVIAVLHQRDPAHMPRGREPTTAARQRRRRPISIAVLSRQVYAITLQAFVVVAVLAAPLTWRGRPALRRPAEGVGPPGPATSSRAGRRGYPIRAGGANRVAV